MSDPMISRAEDSIGLSIGANVEALMTVYRFAQEQGREEVFVAGLIGELAMYRDRESRERGRQAELSAVRCRAAPVGHRVRIVDPVAGQGEAASDADGVAP